MPGINVSDPQKPSPPFGNIVAMLLAAAVILLACFMTLSRACTSESSTNESAKSEAVTSEPAKPEPPRALQETATPIPAPTPEAPQAPASAVAFLDWVKANRRAPAKGVRALKAGRVECYPPGDPDAGWCNGSGQASPGLSYEAKYRATSPAVNRFSVSIPDAAITCAMFDSMMTVRAWNYASSSKEHCKPFDSPEVVQRHVLLERYSGSTTVVSFTEDYLKHDLPFAAVLDESSGLRP